MHSKYLMGGRWVGSYGEIMLHQLAPSFSYDHRGSIFPNYVKYGSPLGPNLNYGDITKRCKMVKKKTYRAIKVDVSLVSKIRRPPHKTIRAKVTMRDIDQGM